MNTSTDQLNINKKLYEIWLGNNKFMSKGKYFIGYV
jgi:hypothetical protein